MSLAPTPVSLSISPSVRFGLTFCQRLWDLSKRQDDIAKAALVADMAADMEVHMVADMEVDKVADMAADKKNWWYPIWQEQEGDSFSFSRQIWYPSSS